MRSICLIGVIPLGLAVLVLGASASLAAGQTDSLAVSVGVQLKTPAGLAGPGAILRQDLASRLSIDALPLPPSAQLSAHGSDGTTDYYSFSTSFKYRSSRVQAGKIYQEQNSDVELAAGIAGQPEFEDSTYLAGMSISGSTLYFVTDRNTVLATLPMTPQDVVTIEDGQPRIILNGSELGIPENTRITALEAAAEDHFMLSFSSSFTFEDLVVRRGDILSVKLSDPNELYILVPREDTYGLCPHCYLTSMSASVNGDVIFRSFFYSPWEG